MGMTLTEIKKELYKQKPLAKFMYIRKGIAYYFTDLTQARIHFEIPVTDMGEADFGPTMKAQHLNAWILEDKQEEPYL
jgi:hypothetical protein